MKKRIRMKRLFIALALVLSHLACVHISYAYCNADWLGRTGLTSAPASVVFYFIIPYAAAVAVCLALAYVLHRKAKVS